MSSKAKVAVVVVVLILALVAGVYLSGFITLLLLNVQVPLKATTYLEYWKALDLPQVKPYVLRVKASGALGFGLPLLGWGLLLIPMLRTRKQSLHGEASFASVADLKKAGMLENKPESILVGKLNGRYIYINGALHVIVVAPTRSGKTTSIAIPVLLTYQQSMVVLDLKGELFKATSGYRASQGQQIYVWAPYAIDGKTHRFNPLTLVPDDPRERIASIQTMAAILYPDEPGKDSFWITQSRAAFVAFACFMFEKRDHLRSQGFAGVDDRNQSLLSPSLERLLRLSAGGDAGQSTADLLKGLLADTQVSYLSPQTRSTFSALAGLAEQTFSSVMATMQAPLQQFLSPILAAATNATDIDVTAIRKRLTTVYVIIPTQKLDESSKLLNIFFSSVIGNNLDKQLNEDPALKYQMLMLMDEFTAMGRVDVWAKRISISASYGVRDLCIIQSQSQLRATYGADDAQNFITNHAASIVFTPREQEDANAYSDMLGYATIRRQHRSTSSGGGASNVSYSYTEERRALMLPQEIKELPGDDELLFFEGSKPIRCEKNWFFKDSVLKSRIMDPVAVPAPGPEQVPCTS
ncbi:type IV secretory system conjugative DNA transfer family protein [Xanthomonas cucurbitae]|uniref:Type IV secretory system conjugative DNA transfer family protein n=1 Tax=Xanthomonas cucurbitae TaxID=56453 RepID=A0ABY7YAE3_9XANT|nr:type IV secretory system conjugative DNA transfer family protein [Xanthomonas cucurbitae]WDM66962.1 type IV secretory system conjugative DNA transfer family protein [Xanthomonas cucurbitae]WDM70838.1 type IV secretory system conjugative DNA transfer family protein [Xanthomonas cucurbitae]